MGLKPPPEAGFPEPPYLVLGFHPVPEFRSPRGLSLRGPALREDGEPENFLVCGVGRSDEPSPRGV